MNDSTILDCGHAPSPHESFTTGYGETVDGRKHCYVCCAADDRKVMAKTGAVTLYLSKHPTLGWRVTNWPGSLKFQTWGVRHSARGGGFGSQRTDAWFRGPDGFVWHAINRGDMDIARCRRTRERSKTDTE